MHSQTEKAPAEQLATLRTIAAEKGYWSLPPITTIYLETHWETTRTPVNGHGMHLMEWKSDHDLVRMNFHVCLNRTWRKQNPRIKLDLEQLKDPEVTEVSEPSSIF